MLAMIPLTSVLAVRTNRTLWPTPRCVIFSLAFPGESGFFANAASVMRRVRNAQIAQNAAPGILNLVNSTVDIAGSAFLSNIGGVVVCDGTGFVVSDMKPAALGSANSCKTANASGAKHELAAPKFNAPDWKKQKALADKIHALVPKFHR